MKTLYKPKNSSGRIKTKTVTLGDLIVAIYDGRGEKGTAKILQLAMESHLIRFKRPSDLSYLHGQALNFIL